MSFLDNVTGFETVQFIMIAGVALIVIMALVLRFWAKSAAVDFEREKQKRKLEHDYQLEVIQAKAVQGSIPGKAIAVQND